MLIGASTFAYTVGAICAILASFGEEFKEYVSPRVPANVCPL